MLFTFIRLATITAAAGYFALRSTRSIREERACLLLQKQQLLRRGGASNLMKVELANQLIDAANLVHGWRVDRERRKEARERAVRL